MKAEEEWPVTFEANRRAQLMENLKLTPEQRLQWVEQAIAFAYEAGALKPSRRLTQEEWDAATHLGWEY
jgi:hypothetical protein